MSQKNVSAKILVDNGKAQYSGWMIKKNPKGKLQNRYFVIVRSKLYYFDSYNSRRPKNVLEISDFTVSTNNDKKEITLKYRGDDGVKDYQFIAPSDIEFTEWFEKLVAASLDVTGSKSYDYVEHRTLFPTYSNPEKEFDRYSPSTQDMNKEKQSIIYDRPRSVDQIDFIYQEHDGGYHDTNNHRLNSSALHDNDDERYVTMGTKRSDKSFSYDNDKYVYMRNNNSNIKINSNNKNFDEYENLQHGISSLQVNPRTSSLPSDAFIENKYTPPTIFFGTVDRSYCTTLLENEIPGTYMIRKSSENNMISILVVLSDIRSVVKQFKIFDDVNGYMFLEENHPKFKQLHDLICHYHNNNLPNNTFKLVQPLRPKH